VEFPVPVRATLDFMVQFRILVNVLFRDVLFKNGVKEGWERCENDIIRSEKDFFIGGLSHWVSLVSNRDAN
jgi:hypothetical protein